MASRILKMVFVKQVIPDQLQHEVELQTISASHGFSPKILGIGEVKGKHYIYMEDLEEECLADMYGDKEEDIPAWVWFEIRHIVTTLLEEEGIEYMDITPYNFIQKDGKIHIIDFGDAQYTNKNIPTNWFLQEFIDGENSWNPDYK
jgi:tRNA A-37 threonylcarbamoyl transferase component Bud32